jgi:hypothetical protein
MDNMAIASIPWNDEEGDFCQCCGLPKWRTSWDLRLPEKKWIVSFGQLRDATRNDCQDCALIFDALSAHIAPKTEVNRAKITIKPFPMERRLYIQIKPTGDSDVSHAEIEVLRNTGML